VLLLYREKKFLGTWTRVHDSWAMDKAEGWKKYTSIITNTFKNVNTVLHEVPDKLRDIQEVKAWLKLTDDTQL